MRIKNFKIIGVTVLMGTILLTKAKAGEIANNQILFNLAPESTLWLQGDSTLHPYSSTASVINIKVAIQGSGNDSQKVVGNKVNVFEVMIPVKDLKSKEKALDKNLWKTLKEPKFPLISFTVTSNQLVHEMPKEANFPVIVDGLLAIAGVEKVVPIEAQGSMKDNKIRLQGTKKLLMSDFGVKPPTMLGFIKTRDEVTIHFDLILTPQN